MTGVLLSALNYVHFRKTLKDCMLEVASERHERLNDSRVTHMNAAYDTCVHQGPLAHRMIVEDGRFKFASLNLQDVC